jgi:hypothetical protein
LFGESRRVETLLRAALGIVEETSHTEAPADQAVREQPTSWPNRENTKEFEAISMEDVHPADEPAAVEHAVDEAHVEDDVPRSGRDFAWG